MSKLVNKSVCGFGLLMLASGLMLTLVGAEPERSSSQDQSLEVQANTVLSPEQASFHLGRMLGIDKRSRYDDLDFDKFYQGFKQGFNDESLTHEDRKNSSDVLIKYYYEKLQHNSVLALKQGREYLQQNAHRKQVSITSSGLQYEVLAKGSGRQAAPNDTVSIHLQGRLISGKEFLNTYRQGKAKQLSLSENQLVPGLIEAIQLMSIGTKMKVVLPPELAYGKQSGGRYISPNSALVYFVELLSIDAP